MRRRLALALTTLFTLGGVLAVTGSGAMAIDPGPLGASPDPVPFGTQAVGVATPAKTVTITDNSGTVPITIRNVSATSDYHVGADNCTGKTLNQTDTCTVDVTFNPSSAGTDNGTLTITDDDTIDGNASQGLSLTGAGVANQFTATGGPLAFPDQRVGTTSTNQSVLVTNNTDYAANPNQTVTGANAGDFNATGCGSAVSGSGTCTVNVTFTPSATGSRSATLNVAGGQVALSGNGTDPGASVSPGSIAFGNQPLHVISGTQTITLQNTGTAPLTYTSPATVGGANPGDFSVSDADCAAKIVLAPTASCTVTVAFNPTATGARAATISLHDDDPQNGTQTVTVSGTGTPSSVGFSPASVIYTRTIPAGTASPGHVVTIRNLTSSPMPIAATAIGGTNPRNFIRSADTCTGTPLPPNGTCTVHVTFTPSAAGRRTAVLAVRDTGTVSPHTHQVTLTGTARAPKNPTRVRGTVGCSKVTVSWVAPTATRFAGTVVVRNHARYPINPGDGTIVPHRTAGVARDRGLKHFKTYYYRVFAKYHSLTHRGQINWSNGVRLREHTGEICTPQNGARLRDLRPRVTWLPYPTQNGYAFVLQRGRHTIWVKYRRRTWWQIPSSWRYSHRAHRLVRGRSYTFYLYAYPSSHPKGIFIGKTSFSER
jgi:hypothetical protein